MISCTDWNGSVGETASRRWPRVTSANRLQVALDVVRQLRHHVPVDREGPDRTHADGVAVGVGLRGEVEPQRQRAARTVVDDDLLPDLLCELGAEDARNRVGGAAGRLRDDELDRLVRILRRGAGREHAREQQRDQSKGPHVTSHACHYERSTLTASRPGTSTSVVQTMKGTTHLRPFSGAREGATVVRPQNGWSLRHPARPDAMATKGGRRMP